MSTARQVAPSDFVRLKKAASTNDFQRVSLTYWQDVWSRFQANRQALACLYILVALLLFTLAGPVLWTVDPHSQDPAMASRAPYFNVPAVPVDPFDYHLPVVVSGHSPVSPSNRETQRQDLPAPEGLRLLAPAHTYSVRLTWQPVASAVRYHIYRHYRLPESSSELGLPLGETLAGNVVSYEDRLKLENRTYYYSVVADDGRRLSNRFATLKVDVAAAISFERALAYGLIEDSANLPTTVPLPARPFGTDYLGRDLLARMMHGARTSLFIGIVAPLCFVAFGMLYGAVAGFAGGWLDSLMMRLADFVAALPFLLFVILFRVAAGIQSGESGIGAIMLAFVLLLWPATARLVRGQILQIRESAYVQSARLLGGSSHYLILKQMLPNVTGPVLVTLTFAIPSAIFIEAFLSFIGMGVAPPEASWGSSCLEGLKTMFTHPHELFFPAFLISLTVLAFNLLGDGLRDALDARLRGR